MFAFFPCSMVKWNSVFRSVLKFFLSLILIFFFFLNVILIKFQIWGRILIWIIVGAFEFSWRCEGNMNLIASGHGLPIMGRLCTRVGFDTIWERISHFLENAQFGFDQTTMHLTLTTKLMILRITYHYIIFNYVILDLFK